MNHLKYIIPVFLFFTSLNLADPIQAQVSSDGSLSTMVESEDNLNFMVSYGGRAGKNIFHSFDKFSVPKGGSVNFVNTSDIQNIISRVTGGSSSVIEGLIKADFNANLFIINPNGIIFGPEAKLDIGGSFVASTAKQLIFADGVFFSADQAPTIPKLTVSIPIGFRFGDQPGNIKNQSQTTAFVSQYDSFLPVGLSVKSEKTIALLGNGVFLEEGNLFAPGGRIEIGSVGSNSFVGIGQVGEGWFFDYKSVNNYQDINLVDSLVITDGEGGGAINFSGRQINISIINSGSSISMTNFGNKTGENLVFNASESLNLDSSNISTSTNSDKNAGNIFINAPKLRIANGSLVTSESTSSGLGGNIKVIAPDSIEVSTRSLLNTGTFVGDAGELMIDTTTLMVTGGGIISTTALGQGNAGDLTITASRLIEVDGESSIDNSQNSGIFSQSQMLGDAGKLVIKTNQLTIKNGAIVQVSALGGGPAGILDIQADNLLLDSQGFLKAETKGGGGNISIRATDIILRNNSLISTNATGSANGGNISINTSLLLALSPNGPNGSDIIAKAVSGTGGKITINAQGVFGIQERKADLGNQTNDIDASSQFGQSGQVQINTTTDPNQGLIELPTTVIDPSTLVAQNPCRRASSSEFTRSGRGGLPPSLSQDLNGESTQVGLVEPTNLSAATPEPKSASKEISPLPLSSAQIVPAQGWVYNAKGEVVLVAYNSAVTGPQRLQSTPAGCPVF